MTQRTIKQALDAMLERREYSVFEIQRKLAQAGFIQASIDAIIRDYEDRGFISNARYVEERVLSLMRKGYGPFYIKMLLAKQQLSFSPSDYQWREAYQIARRKAGNREGIKLQQYMFRRGFKVGEWSE